MIHLATARHRAVAVDVQVEIRLPDFTQVQMLAIVDHEFAQRDAGDHRFDLASARAAEAIVGRDASFRDPHMFDRFGGSGDGNLRRALLLVANVDRRIQRQGIAAIPAPGFVGGEVNQRLDAFERAGIVENVVAPHQHRGAQRKAADPEAGDGGDHKSAGHGYSSSSRLRRR